MSNYIDYAFKSYVLKEHKELFNEYKKTRLLEFAIYQYNQNGEITPLLERLSNDYMRMPELALKIGENNLGRELLECMRIDNANRYRVKRSICI